MKIGVFLVFSRVFGFSILLNFIFPRKKLKTNPFLAFFQKRRGGQEISNGVQNGWISCFSKEIREVLFYQKSYEKDRNYGFILWFKNYNFNHCRFISDLKKNLELEICISQILNGITRVLRRVSPKSSRFSKKNHDIWKKLIIMIIVFLLWINGKKYPFSQRRGVKNEGK